MNIREPNKEIVPLLKIQFMDKKNVLVRTTESNKSHTKDMPYWSTIGEGLLFRGTWSELVNNYIEITIINKGKSIGTAKVQL